MRNNSVTAAGSESNSSRARLSPSKRLFRPSTRRLHALISFSTAATSFRSRSLDSETREDLDAILEFPVDAEEEAARYLVSSLKGSGGQKRANERREGHYELLTTIDGIGPRSAAACIIGEVGDPARGGAGKLRGVWMPTLVVVRINPRLRAHYQRLCAAGKPPKLAKLTWKLSGLFGGCKRPGFGAK